MRSACVRFVGTSVWFVGMVVAIVATGAGCSGSAGGKDGVMKYEVARVSGPMVIDAKWDKPAWQKIKPLEVKLYMGKEPEHQPRVQAKLAYDAANVYVIFRVEDNYVRAVAEKHQGPVCRDSCVEFFFTPGTDVAKGYFNLEMNCGGTMLLHFQTIPREGTPLTDAELARIEVAASQPRIVEPEIATPTVWTVEYRFPVDLIGKYLPAAPKPGKGVQWRANFYKCGDKTSHPHWLTWAKVERPRPDFHVPEDFGVLEFK